MHHGRELTGPFVAFAKERCRRKEEERNGFGFGFGFFARDRSRRQPTFALSLFAILSSQRKTKRCFQPGGVPSPGAPKTKPESRHLARCFSHNLDASHQVAGYERAEQPWYICQECDAEWKHDMEMFRVCVACARNCHKGRLGHRTRFCKLSNTRCMCCERGEGSCLYFDKKVGPRALFRELNYRVAAGRAIVSSASPRQVSPS